MSSSFYIDVNLSAPITPSVMIKGLIEGGWSIWRSDGRAFHVPLGGEIGDWEFSDLSDEELIKTCDEKLDAGETPSITLVYGDTGGNLLFWPSGDKFSLSCNVNTRHLPGHRWLDVNWYLLRLLDYIPAVVEEITCTME